MTRDRAKKSKIIAVAFLAVTAGGLGVAGYLEGPPPEDGTRFYLINDGGPVLFEHHRHGVAEAGCVDCHHELAGNVMDCLDCHDDPDYNGETASHDELLDIHDRTCDTCHEIAAESEAVSCRECHEEELARVYHLSCNRCHLATHPARFADEAGTALCRSCHLR